MIGTNPSTGETASGTASTEQRPSPPSDTSQWNGSHTPGEAADDPASGHAPVPSGGALLPPGSADRDAPAHTPGPGPGRSSMGAALALLAAATALPDPLDTDSAVPNAARPACFDSRRAVDPSCRRAVGPSRRAAYPSRRRRTVGEGRGASAGVAGATATALDESSIGKDKVWLP